MKKFLSTLTAVTFFLFFFNSCANFDNSGTSLTLTFNGRDFIPADERNVTVSSDDAGFYFVVSLSGDYKETKFISFDYNEENYSITFNRVPVGANVTVHANVYRPRDKEHMHYYSGTSDRIEISSGENFVNIDLNNLQVACEDHTFQIYSSNDVYYKGTPGVGIMPTFYYNTTEGKYKIVIDTTGEVLSEGLLSGNMYVGPIYVTEYICSDPIISWNADNSCWDYISTDSAKIITEPTQQVIPITEMTPDPQIKYEFFFKSRNGLEMRFEKQ